MMQDFRGEGAPADIGAFTYPASVIVYQHTFGGVVYVVAARQGDRGWVLISHLQLSGANSTTVINAGLAALSAARTWKELAVVMGNYVDLGIISVASYSELEIIGKWTCQANLGASFIVNSDQVGGNREIFIVGGHINGNGANQNANMNTIYFVKVTDSVITNCRLGGARRVDADGETILLWECTRVIVEGNSFYTATWGYDSIKLRHDTRQCVVANNIIDETNGGTSCGIQLGEITDGYNVVVGNAIYGTGGVGQQRNGIKMHSADKNLIIGNTMYNIPHTGIDVVGNGSNNLIVGNFVHVTDVFGGLSVRATDAENAYDNVFRDNYVILSNVAGSIGIDLWANSRRTRLVGNTVIGGTAADTGINIRAGASDTIVDKNDLSDANLNTKITDAGTGTKLPEIFVVVGNPDTNIGTHPAVNLPDAVDTTVRFEVPFPSLFQQLVRAEVVIVAGGTGNLRRSVATNFGKINSAEDYNTHTDSIAAGEVAVVINDLTCIDIAAAFTGIAVSDWAGVEFTRVGSHVNDTVNAVCYFLGFRLQYV